MGNTQGTSPGTKKSPIVPIVTYHSIVDIHDSWQFRHLSCPVSTFEDHLKALLCARFHTISLMELYHYMAEGKMIPPRSVVLTFDDGYLDNWVYAYPLLKKYGYRGTVFVNPDFVDPTNEIRPNLEYFWNGRVSKAELPTSGFLSWQEMREMERSGHMDVQSHGLTHTWYFSSAEIIDFHCPGDPYPWLAWNAHPERKHLWMAEDQHGFIPWGTPVYQHEKSLATRRYFQDEKLDAVLADYVMRNGSEAFFQDATWRKRLEKVVTNYRQVHGDCGRFESDEEYRARFYSELAESKKIIERQLNKTVDFMCWPGGGYNSESTEIAKEAGYLAFTHSSHDRRTKKNRFGENSIHWSRLSAPVFQWSESRIEYQRGLFFICLLNSDRGSYLSNAMCKALKIPLKLSQWSNRAVS